MRLNLATKPWCILVVAGFLLSCSPPPAPTCAITGRLSGYEGKPVRLLQMVPNASERLVLDTSTVRADGAFRFGNIPLDSSLIQLEVPGGPSWLLVADAKNIETAFTNQRNLPEYWVKGSSGSAWIQQAYSRIKFQESTRQISQSQWKEYATQGFPDSLVRVALTKYRTDSLRLLQLYDSLLRNTPSLMLYRYAAGAAAGKLSEIMLRKLDTLAMRRFRDSSWLQP